MPMAYPFRWPTGRTTGPKAAARPSSMITTQVGADNVAAVLIEPIQGEGGFIVPADGLPAGHRRLAQDHGIVFIADEIQTGFCRTGGCSPASTKGSCPT